MEVATRSHHFRVSSDVVVPQPAIPKDSGPPNTVTDHAAAASVAGGKAKDPCPTTSSALCHQTAFCELAYAR